MGKSEAVPPSDFDGVLDELTEVVRVECQKLLNRPNIDVRDLRRYSPIVLPSPAPIATTVQAVAIVPFVRSQRSSKVCWGYRIYKSPPKVYVTGLLVAPRPLHALPFAFHALLQELEDEGFHLHTRAESQFFEAPEATIAVPHIPLERGAVQTILTFLAATRAAYCARSDQALSGRKPETWTPVQQIPNTSGPSRYDRKAKTPTKKAGS